MKWANVLLPQGWRWGIIYTIVMIMFTSGCIVCTNLKTWTGGERDTALNTVMSLRYHLCNRNFKQASRSIAPGSEYIRARPGDPTTEAYWRIDNIVIGQPQQTTYFPLGPEDEIVGERPFDPSGTQMEVEIRHKLRYGKDPRPRSLILKKFDGEWLITGYRNW
jgi:hypothetical protein